MVLKYSYQNVGKWRLLLREHIRPESRAPGLTPCVDEQAPCFQSEEATAL